MTRPLIDDAIFRDPAVAADFIGNVLESSTEYSIIAADLDGKVVLWNEGARRIDGYEVLARLRADEPWPAYIPVFAMTALAMVGDHDGARAAGFTSYLTKPIDPQSLATTVEAQLPVHQRGNPVERNVGAMPSAPDTSVEERGTVLAVDDSGVNIQLLQRILKPQGSRVVGAATLAEAVAANQTHRPFLVLCDVHIGVDRGEDVVAALRATRDQPPPTIAFLTASVPERRRSGLGAESGATCSPSRSIRRPSSTTPKKCSKSWRSRPEMATVLIVDDRPTNRQALRTLVASRGHDVVEAETRAAAIDLARVRQPDLVITDILMPGIDGYEVARTLRGDAATAGITIAFHTPTYVEEEVRPVAEACGVRHIIPKSADPVEMLAAIDAALADSTAHAGLPLDVPAEFDQRHLRALNAKLVEKVEELDAMGIALGESETRYRRLTEQAPIGIFATDLEHRGTYFNPAACALLGAPADQLLGDGWRRVLDPDDLTRIRGEVAPAIAERRAFHFEGTAVHPDGARAVVEVHGVPVPDATGEITGYVGTMIDLTAVRDAEREREALASRLAVSERLEALGQLAGGIAHDYNNVLGVILNYVTFVERALEEATRQGGDPALIRAIDDLARISEAARRAAGLSKQLLVFGRKDLLESQRLDVGVILRGLGELLGRTIGEQVALRFDVAPDLWAVDGDASEIEHAVMNLVLNARDAMPDGGRIDVTAHNTTGNGAPGPGVRIEVTDTGAGMTRDVLDHAFEPFFTTKPKGKGTGLGLATMFGAVTATGGTVEIASEPGAGTTVVLWLPKATSGPASAAVTLLPQTAPGGRILLVEDEPDLRESTARLLAEKGYDVVTAADAAEALELLASTPVDLLLTDVVMPGASGFALAEAAQRDHPGLPVLCMSGYADPVVVPDGTKQPAVVLAKPFTSDDLFSAVGRALDAATKEMA